MGFKAFDRAGGAVLASQAADQPFAAMSATSPSNPTPDRDLVLGALGDAPRTAADGFDQYFGIPDGMPNTGWAIKQGWGTSGSDALMSSTGLVGTDLRYVVVVLASAPASSYSELPAVVTAGTAALAGLIAPTAP